MPQIILLLSIIVGILIVSSVTGFAVAFFYIKLRLPTSTKRAQALDQYNKTAREHLLQIHPLLALEPLAESPLHTLDSEALALFADLGPLLQHLDGSLLPELQQVWQVGIDSQLLIPFKVTERISALEVARKKIDKGYTAYLADRVLLDRLITLQQKYSQLQQIIETDLQRQRGLLDGVLARLETARLSDEQAFFDVELQIERLSDSLREVEALFDFESLAVHPEGIHHFRHVYNLMYPRLIFFDTMLPQLNYRLHQLTRAQRYLQRERVRLSDLDQSIQQQLNKAETRQIDVTDLWQKYQVAQDNLARTQQAFDRRSTETYISMAGSLTRRGEVNDTRLELISAELRNILSETRTRLSLTVQLEHLHESIHLLGDLHEELRGLVQTDEHTRYEKYLSIITDLSLDLERRREALEDKQAREQLDTKRSTPP
ncbi:MAG: hypothetical protein ACPG8W_02175 [Candidatus Promineifilaceae bacterium]